MENNKKSNTIAIVGFILSFFVSIAGLVCSIIGLKKSKELNGDGKSLSIAGIIISSVVLLVQIITIIFILITSLVVVNNFDSTNNLVNKIDICTTKAYDCTKNTDGTYSCKYLDDDSKEQNITCNSSYITNDNTSDNLVEDEQTYNGNTVKISYEKDGTLLNITINGKLIIENPIKISSVSKKLSDNYVYILVTMDINKGDHGMLYVYDYNGNSIYSLQSYRYIDGEEYILHSTDITIENDLLTYKYISYNDEESCVDDCETISDDKIYSITYKKNILESTEEEKIEEVLYKDVN